MMQQNTPTYDSCELLSVDEAMMALCAVDPDGQAARHALQRAIHAVTLELAAQVPLYLGQED